jgi:hypothetical protein
VGGVVRSANPDDDDIAAEIRSTYIDTMQRLYLSQFKTYLAAMKKLQATELVERGDVLGVDGGSGGKGGGGGAAASGSDGGGGGGFLSSLTSSLSSSLSLSTKKSQHHLLRVFSLGQRASTVLADDASRNPIVPHVSAKRDVRFAFEVLYRSCQHMLVDACTR